MGTEGLGGVNGVVVGEGHDGHPALLAAEVDLGGIVVGFPADEADTGSVAHPRGNRMNVKVAAHDSFVNSGYEQAMKKRRNVDKCVHGTN